MGHPRCSAFGIYSPAGGTTRARTIPILGDANVLQPDGTTIFTRIGAIGAMMLINSNPAAPWLTGFNGIVDTKGLSVVQAEAATIMHELGHVFEILIGPGSTSIKNDFKNTKQSKANTKLVIDSCIH